MRTKGNHICKKRKILKLSIPRHCSESQTLLHRKRGSRPGEGHEEEAWWTNILSSPQWQSVSSSPNPWPPGCFSLPWELGVECDWGPVIWRWAEVMGDTPKPGQQKTSSTLPTCSFLIGCDGDPQGGLWGCMLKMAELLLACLWKKWRELLAPTRSIIFVPCEWGINFLSLSQTFWVWGSICFSNKHYPIRHL